MERRQVASRRDGIDTPKKMRLTCKIIRLLVEVGQRPWTFKLSIKNYKKTGTFTLIGSRGLKPFHPN